MRAVDFVVFFSCVLATWWRSLVEWLLTTPPLARAPQLRAPPPDWFDCKLVLISGNMGDASRAAAALANMGLPVILPEVGPVSSCHDRACEIFYSLKGGCVDYGAEHSKAHGHSRHGTHERAASHADWSAERPVLLVTHSQVNLYSFWVIF